MQITRRDLGRLGLGAVALAGLGARPAWAASDATQEAIMAFTGGATPAEGGIDLTTPEIAENGSTVPVEVSAEGATRIMLLADGNPNPGVATFHFSPANGEALASTRIRLAKSQNIVAVAK
ncbi:MAG: thiosulfate oxidation carrier protein SoxY, partial [Pseudomonadota bacterium]